jgi:type I restriction enzyme S subunit
MKEGWKSSKLYEIGIVQTGTTPPSKIKEYYGNYIPFIKPPHFNADGSIIYGNEGLSEKGLSKGRLIKENSVLMVCIGATIGKTGISDKPISCNQQINTFTPNKNHEPKFFYYLLSSSMFFKEVMKLSSQATLPMINKTKWQNIEVNYPPFPEQKQIVTILDQAFESIAQAKANIEKNIENAKELFQSKLNDIFSQKCDGWEEISLSEVCQIQPPKTEARKELGKDEMVSFVPMKEMGINEMYFKSVQYKELQEVSNSYTYFKNNDVLLAKITPCFENGKLGIAQGLINNIGFGSSEYIVYRPSGNLLPEFLYHFLNQQTFRKNGARVMTGAVGHKRIPKEFYEGYKIKIPSLAEQKDILSKMNVLSANSEKIKDSYFKKLILLEDLKKSILQKTFAGELTGKELAIEVE